MSYKSIIWIVPFLSFFTGYFLLSFIFPAKTITTPQLVGKTMLEAVSLLSEHNLSLRIIGTKQEEDIAEGTILSQMPTTNSKIKQNQTIQCVISTKTELPKISSFLGKSRDHIESLLNEQKIRYKLFYVTSALPENSCIAQHPAPTSILAANELVIIYLSNGLTNPIIWPNFKGKPVEQVKDFLSLYGLQATGNHTHLLEPQHQCTHCIVIDQRPLPGSIISIKDPSSLQVQLQVKNYR